MAHYLVRAEPKESRMSELAEKLAAQEFVDLQPFGQALTEGLNGARLQEDGRAVWEEEDYCSPPLAMEREAVLDTYFHAIEVQKVRPGEGWQQIDDLPRLFHLESGRPTLQLNEFGNGFSNGFSNGSGNGSGSGTSRSA